MFTQFSSEDESLGRYIALVSSVGSWFKNIEWVKYGDYSSYLTLPGKGLPLYFNGTSATLHAVLGTIAAVGLSKWDLGFPGGFHTQSKTSGKCHILERTMLDLHIYMKFTRGSLF